MFQEYGSKNFAGCLRNRGESVQIDFHYYATYCAAYLAGYSHEESMEICTSAQFVDLCSLTLLKTLEAPLSAATTQLTMEMADEAISPKGSMKNIHTMAISTPAEKLAMAMAP